ncbi:taxis cluster protein CheC [Natronomonas pharaonis DSM 2160]|uniref:Taxis cluster protein CheC n=1 Tax=Natronomonas pharaonis (strain ATCC 35678 / DSM 2160 / CIP 103997 / JCM 8858 / NBRC 14720 / NCIMB 2260 / Gabara) TaxID=348780 RepID=A0A1U7EVR8_NATPD|nr:chemotaxis protein CheC [Natronomonas pharaonis]CAI49143.1 taxis cluster protein CheC [Natronomonas pharaonis DSM 2160]
MQIDIDSLETYNTLARDGAQSAAQSLSQLTGIDTHVEVTNVSLMDPSDLEYEYIGGEFSGVEIGLEGALSGETVLTFDEAAQETITNVLAPGADEAMRRSSIKEVGNIMTSGFIDGWADHLDAQIDISTPTYLEGTGSDVLPASAADSDEQVFVFRSRVEAVSEAVDFHILLVPERDTLVDALDPDEDDSIPFEKFEVFNEMTMHGAEKAAENITTMTGLTTDVEVNRMTFVPIDDVPAEVGDRRYVGTVMEYEGTPSGYLVILFDQSSASSVVDALVPVETDGDWGEMEQSAMKELGNIMTSGFIDGWANVLQTSIDHSPPTFVADMGSSIMSPIVGRMARTQEHAFMLDSVINTDGDGVFRCEMFALPDEAELTDVLDDLLVERADETEVEPDEVF